MIAEPSSEYGKQSAIDEALPELHVGDKIKHKKFGKGAVVSIGADRVTASFSTGTKTLITETVLRNGIVSIVEGQQ